MDGSEGQSAFRGDSRRVRFRRGTERGRRIRFGLPDLTEGRKRHGMGHESRTAFLYDRESGIPKLTQNSKKAGPSPEETDPPFKRLVAPWGIEPQFLP